MYEIPCSEWTHLMVSEHTYRSEGTAAAPPVAFHSVFCRIRFADESGPPCGSGDTLLEAIDETIMQHEEILRGLQRIRAQEHTRRLESLLSVIPTITKE